MDRTVEVVSGLDPELVESVVARLRELEPGTVAILGFGSYGIDLPVALGLEEADDRSVVDATLRLGRELLASLREHDPAVDKQPDIARDLADGTLERHLGFD